jgi:hypothetical protein
VIVLEAIEYEPMTTTGASIGNGSGSSVPANGTHLCTPHDDIMVCTAKEIWSETRTWVVDGRVVTASGYKVGTIKRYTSPHQVDERITAFAQACANRWRPNPAFVLDVADTPAGLKIVEINNLNAAGLYRGDMQKLVVALADLAEASYL